MKISLLYKILQLDDILQHVDHIYFIANYPKHTIKIYLQIYFAH